MPARKKPEHLKTTATIPLRVTNALKKDLDDMADETGVSTSERARTCLEKSVEQWKADKQDK